MKGKFGICDANHFFTKGFVVTLIAHAEHNGLTDRIKCEESTYRTTSILNT